MILDPDACIPDAGFFPDGPTDGRTDKPILGVGYIQQGRSSKEKLNFFQLTADLGVRKTWGQ